MYRHSLCLLALATMLTGCAPFGTATNVSVSPMFSDHMVLQRDIPLKVWGNATPGQTVIVSIARQDVTAVANKEGKWTATLAPRPAGGPHSLRVAGKQAKVFTDVLYGDVWICSGQSNMGQQVASSLNPAEEIAAANYPQIRFYSVPNSPAVDPLPRCFSGWEVCSPNNVGIFSAAGYFFGRDLHKSLNVPIGLINSSWGGTCAQVWTSREAMESVPELKHYVDALDKKIAANPAGLKAYRKAIAEWEVNTKAVSTRFSKDPGIKYLAEGWAKTDFDDSKWKQMALPSMWEKVMNIDGIVWFRKEVTIPAAWAGKDLELSLGAVDDMNVTYFNNVEVGRTGMETREYWSAKRNYTVPAKLVGPGKAVITVRVMDHYMGGGFGGPAAAMHLSLKSDKKPMPLTGNWKYRVAHEFIKRGAPTSVDGFQITQGDPTALYNGMINPLIPYGIKGAIWYQGEGNAGRATEYRTLLKVLITDWRTNWGQGDFPFIIVQLANFMGPVGTPVQPGWAELREAQAMALELPNTGLAVAIDIGDAADIHPKNKQDVGKRLALSARKIAYGEDIVYSGPTYKKMKVEGKNIRLLFDNVGGGLMAKGGQLKTFAIAGKNGKFYHARARIDRNTVLVAANEVPNPTAVRYAWANNPVGCNLYNAEGLPAVPFRTDVK